MRWVFGLLLPCLALIVSRQKPAPAARLPWKHCYLIAGSLPIPSIGWSSGKRNRVKPRPAVAGNGLPAVLLLPCKQQRLLDGLLCRSSLTDVRRRERIRGIE
jgi:hypothetical protein